MARRGRVTKTNAMRELEAASIRFEPVTYEVDESDTSSELGLHIAEMLGDDPASSFKTLVCVAPSGDHVTCCIPVAAELDLKRAAAAAGEKSLELMTDRIVDITATGSTLRENDLVVIDDVMECTARFFAGPAAYRCDKRIRDLAARLAEVSGEEMR